MLLRRLPQDGPGPALRLAVESHWSKQDGYVRSRHVDGTTARTDHWAATDLA